MSFGLSISIGIGLGQNGGASAPSPFAQPADATPAPDTIHIDPLNYIGEVDWPEGNYPPSFTPTPAPSVAGQTRHVLMYGQSVGMGYHSKPTITGSAGSPVPDCVMFNGGVNTRDTSEDPAVSMSSLVSYYEQAQGANDGESPGGGFAYMLKQLFTDDHSTSFSTADLQLLISSAGQDGQALYQLAKGTYYYDTRMLDQVTAANTLVAAASRTYVIDAMLMTQGENDYSTTPASYLSQFQTFQSNAKTDIRGITGGTDPLPMIHYQSWFTAWQAAPETTMGSAIGQLMAHEADPDNFILACPVYFMNANNVVHLDAYCSAWLGAYYALAYKRKIVDGGSWSPTRPTSISVSGREATITFSIRGTTLAFDTQSVRYAANYGFRAYDSSGNAITITDVSMISATQVKVTLGRNIRSGDRLKYADKNTDQEAIYGGTDVKRPMFGARGNLRDNAGDVLKFKHPIGVLLPMHNWCVCFDKVLL